MQAMDFIPKLQYRSVFWTIRWKNQAKLNEVYRKMAKTASRFMFVTLLSMKVFVNPAFFKLI